MKDINAELARKIQEFIHDACKAEAAPPRGLIVVIAHDRGDNCYSATTVFGGEQAALAACICDMHARFHEQFGFCPIAAAELKGGETLQ